MRYPKTLLEGYLSADPYYYIFATEGVNNFTVGMCCTHAQEKVSNYIDQLVEELTFDSDKMTHTEFLDAIATYPYLPHSERKDMIIYKHERLRAITDMTRNVLDVLKDMPIGCPPQRIRLNPTCGGRTGFYDGPKATDLRKDEFPQMQQPVPWMDYKDYLQGLKK